MKIIHQYFIGLKWSVFCVLITAQFGCSNLNEDGLPSVRAIFSVSDTVIVNGESVQFTDVSTGDPDTWFWTFDGGDPAIAGEKVVSVRYDRAGRFPVNLRVSKGSEVSEVTVPNLIAVLFDPRSHLLIHYPFEGDAADISGGMRDGILRGASLSFEDARVEKGIRFNNTPHSEIGEINDYVQLPDVFFSGVFTVSFWMKFNSNAGFEGADGSIYSLGYLGTNEDDPSPTTFSFAIQVNSNGAISAVISSNEVPNNAVSISSMDPGDGEWHHVAVVVSSRELKLYVDAQLKGSEFHYFTVVFENDVPQDLALQRWVSDGKMMAASRFNGMLDEFRIYDLALNALEISAVMNAQ